MPDYQEMYYIMARASEKAIRLLIEAQQRCETLAMEESEPLQMLTPNNSSELDETTQDPLQSLGFSLQEGKN